MPAYAGGIMPVHAGGRSAATLSRREFHSPAFSNNIFTPHDARRTCSRCRASQCHSRVFLAGIQCLTSLNHQLPLWMPDYTLSALRAGVRLAKHSGMTVITPRDARRTYSRCRESFGSARDWRDHLPAYGAASRCEHRPRDRFRRSRSPRLVLTIDRG